MTPSPEPRGPASPPARARVAGEEPRCLRDGWQAAATAPGALAGPSGLRSLDWWPARVPGTAAGALRGAGQWRAGEQRDFDGEDWWFRTEFSAEAARAGEEVWLGLDGVATVCEVYLNGELVLAGESMFSAHRVEVGRLLGEHNELAICCRALAPLLDAPRRPRARWRTRLVANGNLRFVRTMLLGRAPGFAPGPAAVGPWRAVWLERHREVAVESLALRPGLRGPDGRLEVDARLRTLAGVELSAAHVELAGATGVHRAPLTLHSRHSAVSAAGELHIEDVARWWPHTHGEPCLYDARLVLQCGQRRLVLEAGRVGFRSLSPGPAAGHEIERDGLDLHVNGVRVFARGAVWTPLDFVGLAPSPADLRAALEQVRDAGMNMLRVPGTGAYEQPAFYDLCDELGVLVWQDLMFANMDYPITDAGFRSSVTGEVRGVLAGLRGRPSIAVVCGNSEVEQQVAMLGLDPSLGRGELFGGLLPQLLAESGLEALYVPSAPCGGELPFRPGHGVANYYGVGGYRRPLEDARRAEVRFAAECLAFSNVPDEAAIEEMVADDPAILVVHHPRWKAGVPRDAGSGWDFEDVRDHYLRTLFGVDASELRRFDHERYLELSRALTGEIMAEVFGEWRRGASPCAGAIVLWLRDLVPGAGWGLLDHRGEPKVAYHHVRRALAPVAVWITDEGLAGVRVHVANDRARPMRGILRVALYRDFEHGVGESKEMIELARHSVRDWDLEALLGRFVDASWAYRFGPPAQDVIVATLEDHGAASRGAEPISQAVRFPAARPLAREPAARLGLEASAAEQTDGSVLLSLRARRLAYGVRVSAPGFRAGDDAFCIEPGATRRLLLSPHGAGETSFAGAWVTALNLDGRLAVAREPKPSPDPAAPAPLVTAGDGRAR